MEEVKERRDKATSVPYYMLFSFADSFDRLLMIIGTIAAIGNGTCTPIMSVLFGNLIDYAGKSSDKSAVREVCQVSLKFLYLALGSGLASFLQVTCWMITAERQFGRIRSTYLRTILRQDIAFFDNEISTGEAVARMSSETILIKDAMGEKVGRFVQLLATFVSGFIVAFAKGWLLTVALLSAVPLIVLLGAITVIFVHKLAREAQNSYSIAAIVAEQTISSIRTVVSFCGEKQAIRKYNKALDKAYKSCVQEGLAVGLGFGILGFIIFCSYGFAIWYGGRMIVKREYTGGEVICVIFAVLLGSFSLGQASPFLKSFAAGQTAVSKMLDTISRNPDIDALDVSGQTLENIKGDIELRNVHFSYPARPNEQILCRLSLFIPGGSNAALVGQSGSGKSTVINLIERFYDPRDGQVFIDGINIKNLQLRWIRSKISLVSQEPVLFSGSIRDNIAYGKDGATDEEIIAAAKLANAAKFIQALPQGLDTMVGEHGVHLSGGQKQSIAIARAIIKEPKILLLDEATSALDVKSERLVQEALDKVMISQTTVVIAHRLSTIRNADKIYVIHQGEVVESGSHSELIKASDGMYSQLIQLQETSKRSDYYVTNDRYNHQMMFSVPYSVSPNFSGSTPEGSLFSIPFSTSPRSNSSQKMGEADTNSLDSDMSLRKADFSLLRLACLNKPEVPVILLGTIMAAVNGTVYPIFGSFLARIIEIFHEQASELLKDARYQALRLVLLGLASFLATPSSTYLFAVAGCKLIRRIRSMCFEKIVYMEVSWFDEDAHSSGGIGSRLLVDAASIRSLVGDTLALLVQNFATVVAAVLMAFKANWELALIMLFLLPFIGISGYIQMKSMKGFGADSKKMYEEANQIASDAVSNIRTVASFCSEEKTVKLYQRKCEGPIKSGMRMGLISGVGFGLSFFFINFVNAVSFYSGAQLVYHHKTTFIKVFQVYFVLLMAALGISQANSLAPDANKARSSSASIFDILDKKSEIDASDSSGGWLENVKGDIRFHNIWFAYPRRPDIKIFNNFCLSIYAGQTLALVGESGSGKSTVVSLLQRYYNPDSGHIYLDGTDIQSLNVKWLRQQMGLVSQEPILFNESIRENIAYGKEGDVTEAEIIATAELANAHNFISGLQQGYDTLVGERGVHLSGGQKQRIAIARAIVKTPKILLLDEATSALDAESERVVQAALDRVTVNRTTLVIAHRLSTIRNADLIAVLRNGQIAEKGTHETLNNIKNGIYASLVAANSFVSAG